MIYQSTIDAILAGEFSGEFATDEQKDVRAAYVVKRLGSTRGTANIQRLVDECEHPRGVPSLAPPLYATATGCRSRGRIAARNGDKQDASPGDDAGVFV